MCGVLTLTAGHWPLTTSPAALTPGPSPGGRGEIGDGFQMDFRPEAAGEGHFGDGDGQAAFAEVVAGEDHPGMDRPVQSGERFLGGRGVEPGHFAAGEALDQREMRAAEFVLRQADLIEDIARRFEIHRDAAGYVFDLAEGADQERRGDGDGAGGGKRSEFVVQAVFAADEGRAQGDGHVVAGQGGAHQ